MASLAFTSSSCTTCARRSLGSRRVLTKASKDQLPKPDWMPEQGVAVLDFLNSKDFDINTWAPYKDFMETYANDKTYSLLYGWKELPELINGRAAMLGFMAAAGAELLGAGPVLNQLASAPQAVLSLMVLVTASSAVPIVKGVSGDYIDSVKETYTIPEGVFTSDIERVHSRLAMCGLFTLILLEMCTGSAVL